MHSYQCAAAAQINEHKPSNHQDSDAESMKKITVMNLSKHVIRIIPIICLSLVGSVASADVLADLDFETAGQYSANFRVLSGNGMAVQTSNGEANDHVEITGGSSNPTGLAAVYDTTPEDGTEQTTFTVGPNTTLTVSLDVRFGSANKSFGIYLINPASENSTTAYLALLNVDASGANEQIRFSKNANPANLVGAGTLVNGSFPNNADAGATVGDEFYKVTLTYNINGDGRPVLGLKVNETTSTIVFTDVLAFPLVEIGFRASPTGGTQAANDLWFDNFVVSTESATESEATIIGQPLPAWVYEGNSVAIDTVTYGGTPPLFYQWHFEGSPIDGETNAAINLVDVTPTMEGNYSVTVWNDYGTNSSANAFVTVVPQFNTSQMSNIWDLLPGDRDYITTTTGGQRGLAYNPATDNLLLVSHVPTNAIVILDPATGAEKGFMNVSGLPAGAAGVNVIGVADDGVVYAVNVTANASSPSTPLILTRWDSDDVSAEPVQLLAGDPGYYATETGGNARRWGDNMTVRGSGADTQILLGPGLRDNVGTTNVCFFVTEDGFSFMPMVISITGATQGFSQWGVAFGPGTNTFWAKGTGRLYLVQFDLETQTGFVLHSYTNIPNSWKLISTDSSKRWLAGVHRVGNGLADNVQLYDISDLENGPVLLDQEIFTTAVLSGIEFGVGSGATAFGGNRLFALSEANGIKAFEISESVPLLPFPVTLALEGVDQVRLSWPSEPGHTYQVQTRSSLVDGEWSDVGEPITASGSSAAWTNTIGGSAQFYRVEAK